MIYVTEISDKEIRGSLGMTVQVMNNLGSLTVYSIGPFVSYTALNAIILSIPVSYAILCSWIPESPYYHLKDGRVEAAKKVFLKLKGTTDEKVYLKSRFIVRLFIDLNIFTDLINYFFTPTGVKGKRRCLIFALISFNEQQGGQFD